MSIPNATVAIFIFLLYYHTCSDLLFLRNTKYPMIEPKARSLSEFVMEILAVNECDHIIPVIRQSRKLPTTNAVTKIMNFVLRLSFPVFSAVCSIVCVLFTVIVFVIVISPYCC